jgi:hypothetical protein
MSYYRSYFEKNNTILKGMKVNTAKNPSTEIFYGSGFSKFIFKIDLNGLKEKVSNGDYVLDNTTKHVLHMTNTIFGDETFLGAKRGTGRERTTSFKLVIFKVTQYWDEGAGFDYEDSGYDYTTGNNTFDIRPSNWFMRTTLDTWGAEGIYSNNPIVIATQNFDNGNENLEVDITPHINDVLTGTTIDQGLGIAFDPLYEDLTSEVDQSVAFFSKYTQTFFEPYLETKFEDRIVDDRENFIEKTDQNLFLYVNKETNFFDLDTLPAVDILDSTKTPISGLTDLTVTKVRKGVYRVTFGIDGLVCDGKKFFYDVWKGISVENNSFPNITQKFVPKPYSSKFSIGENQTEVNKYVVQYKGIKQNEKIKSGETRKVSVNFRTITKSTNVLFDEVFYRIYIKEGHTNVNVFDWTYLDVTNENSFMLDTSILIPREYYLEIKGVKHNEEIFYPNEIKFEIVSEK